MTDGKLISCQLSRGGRFDIERPSPVVELNVVNYHIRDFACVRRSMCRPGFLRVARASRLGQAVVNHLSTTTIPLYSLQNYDILLMDSASGHIRVTSGPNRTKSGRM
jgi:hypothetical protein